MADASAPLMLSVSGLRGVIGTSLTPEVAARYAASIGQWVRQQSPGGTDRPHLVLGRDSRASGQMIESAVVAGLLAVGCRVTTLGIVTTPGVAVAVSHFSADAGVVITASHNPIQWNGIKVIGANGAAPPASSAQAIIDQFKSGAPAYVPVTDLKHAAHDSTVNAVHVRRVLDLIDAASIRQRKLKAVVDSVCGAGGIAAAELLRSLGVERVHLNAEPTGRFPHEPEPTRENLTGLADAVRQHKADIGFAQDPDADRLALVDERGVYIGEEYTLALCALHLLSRTPGPAVANLSTSRMIDDVAARLGTKVHRTPVGEANVAAVMARVGAVVGGEGNGGIIWPRISYVRDSIAGMGLVLQLMATTGKSLSSLVADIPSYAIVKDKIAIRPGLAEQTLRAVQQAYKGQTIDTQDGVRVDWPDRWVHVRPSNTEPIIRIIAEATTQDAAQKLIDDVRARIA